MRTGQRGKYEVTLHHSPLDQLDAMAETAGLRLLASRWHDSTGTPLRPDNTDPVSVYRQTRRR